MVLLISYDLNAHEQPSAYKKIQDAIDRKSEGQYRDVLHSQWAVSTQDTPAAWFKYLQAENTLDGNDRILINKLKPSPESSGRLSKGVWEWIQANQ